MDVALIVISVLSLVGIFETIYLIHGRTKKKPLVCPIGGDCSSVLESEYNKIFGFHNDVLGLPGYIAIGLSALYGLPILKLLIAFGSLLSLYFTYIQWRVIKHWCFWCLMSAFTMWTMAVILYFFT